MFPFKIPIFVMWVFILSFFLFLFCDNPPSFPLDTKINPIDCESIFVKNVQKEENKIKFEIEVNEFPEYPKEVAPYLISIETKMKNSSLEYTYDDFIDLKSNVDNFSFSIIHLINGDVELSVKCYDKELSRTNLNINNISFHINGMSTIELRNEISIFSSFCFYQGSLVYASSTKGNINNIVLSESKDISVKFDYRQMDDFRNVIFGTPLFQGNSIFIYYEGKTMFDSLTQLFIPTFLALENAENNFFLLNYPSKSIVQNLFKLNVKNIETIDLDGRCCFVHGKFINTQYLQSISNFNKILNELNTSLTSSFRETFTNQKMIVNRIVCDHKFSKIIKETNNISFIEIPTTDDISNIAELISSAEVYISTDVSTLIYSLFMNENGKIVQISSDQVCESDLLKTISRLTKCEPYFIQSDECTCNNIECYNHKKNTFNGYSKQKIMEFLDKILNKT